MEKIERRGMPSGDLFAFSANVTRQRIKRLKRLLVSRTRNKRFLLAPIMTLKLARQTVNKQSKGVKDLNFPKSMMKTRIGQPRATLNHQRVSRVAKVGAVETICSLRR